MNSLRAPSSRPSRSRISFSVVASWPTSSLESTGIGVEKSPSRHPLGRRLEPAQAPRVRAGGEEARRPAPPPEAIAPGDQDLALDQGDVVVDVGERVGEDDHPARLAGRRERRARSRRRARRRSARRRSPRAGLERPRSPPGSWARARCARGPSRRRRTRDAARRRPSRTPRTVTLARRALREAQRQAAKLGLGAAARRSRTRAPARARPPPPAGAGASRPSGSRRAAARRTGR